VADDLDALRAELSAYGVRLRKMITPDTTMQEVRAVIQAVQDLPPTEIDRLADIVSVLKTGRLEARLTRPGAVAFRVIPPYPADLVRDPPQATSAKVRRAQLQALVMVLVWLLAITVPLVQQRLSAEAQSVTDAEVGTISLALAVTALMKARK
jgi:hypothetical protein